MIDGRRVLGLIPARGGSKGLPGKNIRPLCGKPLIAWTIEKALKSRYLDKVLVSTDSPEIAAIATGSGASAPFLRPAELATDTAPTLDVVKHALSYCREQENREYDYVVLLEPTSPLREDDDIDNMLSRLHAKADEFDAIVSVGEVNEHPSIMKRLVDGRIQPFYPEISRTTRRQDNAPAYFPYGVAYIIKTGTLLAEGTFYPDRCTYYCLRRYQNYEIDGIYDFLCVENIMRYEWSLR